MGKIYEQNKHRAVGDKQYSEQKRNQLQGRLSILRQSIRF